MTATIGVRSEHMSSRLGVGLLAGSERSKHVWRSLRWKRSILAFRQSAKVRMLDFLAGLGVSVHGTMVVGVDNQGGIGDPRI